MMPACVHSQRCTATATVPQAFCTNWNDVYAAGLAAGQPSVKACCTEKRWDQLACQRPLYLTGVCRSATQEGLDGGSEARQLCVCAIALPTLLLAALDQCMVWQRHRMPFREALTA